MLLFYINLLSFLFLSEYCKGTSLKTAKRCVPTATVHGPCHDCVCTAEGLFHCQHRQCTDVELGTKIGEKNCVAGYVYRDETTYCLCSEIGYWQSDNCQEKFKYLLSKKKRAELQLRTNVVCKSGNLYVIDCNICRCESNEFIEVTTCTKRDCFVGHKSDPCEAGDYLRTDNEICACSDINVYIDRLCLPIDGHDIHKIENDDISKLVEIGKSWRPIEELMNRGCSTETVYSVDCNKCSCDDNKLVCTTEECWLSQDMALRSGESITVKDNAFQSLPELKALNDTCEPGKHYRYKCNTCQCTENGVLNCATMMCLEDYALDKKDLRGALKLGR